MAIVERNGSRIYYESMGEGPAIVLGHSFLCTGDMWCRQLATLAESHRVINVDLRGHGQSSVVDKPFTLYDLVDDVLAVLDHAGIDRAVWAGLSIGGMVGLRAAIVAPHRVAGLVLLDTHAGAETAFNRVKFQLMAAAARVLGMRALAPEIARMFFSSRMRESQPDLVRDWKDRFASVPLRSALRTAAALRTRDSIVEQLARLEVPAVVIVGAEDQPTPPAYSEEIAARLPGAKLVVIERAGHLSTLEQPEAVTSAMVSFLAGLAPSQ